MSGRRFMLDDDCKFRVALNAATAFRNDRMTAGEIFYAARIAHGGGLFETMPQTVDQAIDMFDEHGIEIIELTEE